MTFDPSIFFAIVGGLLLLAGLVGAFLPVLPGPPLAWAGLVAASFCAYARIELWILVATGIAAAIVTAIDYIFPSIITKKSDGCWKDR